MNDHRDTGRSSRPGRLAEMSQVDPEGSYARPEGQRLSMLSHPLTKPLTLLLTVALAAGALGYTTASLRFAEISKRQAAQGEQMRQRISFLESVAAQQALSSARAQSQPQMQDQDKALRPAMPMQMAQAGPGGLPQVQALQIVRPVAIETTGAPAAPQPTAAKLQSEQAALARKATLAAQEAKAAKEAAPAREARQAKLSRPGAQAPATTVASPATTGAPAATSVAAVDAHSKTVKVPAEKLAAGRASMPPAASPSPAAAAEPGVVVASMIDAGVLEVRHDGLKMKNGKTVKVGERFETGETLLSVNPADKRIQTDRRVLMLL